MIAEIDAKLSSQLDQILHHADVQKLESAWRGLKLTIDRTNFRENIKIELLNVSKDDLQTDFEDAPEIVKSGLYKIAYTAEYGTFGGKPIGAMFGNYEFGPGAQDIQLLSNLAAVACMAHAPFFAAAGSPVLQREGLPQPAEPQGPQVDLRGPAVHQVELVPRVRGRALRRPDGAALPAAPALRRDHGSR